jgi:hypothetical protein
MAPKPRRNKLMNGNRNGGQLYFFFGRWTTNADCRHIFGPNPFWGLPSLLSISGPNSHIPPSNIGIFACLIALKKCQTNFWHVPSSILAPNFPFRKVHFHFFFGFDPTFLWQKSFDPIHFKPSKKQMMPKRALCGKMRQCPIRDKPPWRPKKPPKTNLL